MLNALDSTRTSIQVNSDRLMQLFHGMQRNEFEERFSTLSVNVKEFFFCVRGSPNEPSSKPIRAMNNGAEGDKRKKPLKVSMFLGIGNAVLSEICTDQARLVPFSSLDVPS